jgi:hypothetical protein
MDKGAHSTPGEAAMRQPADLAQLRETNPQLPPGEWERVAGYGVMGLTFRSGHVLGMRRWTASSIGERFTSIWHRDPAGRWTFYETSPREVACSRYFGAGVDEVLIEPIELGWEGPRRLRVRTVRGGGVDWTVDLGATAVTRMMSAAGSVLPSRLWRSRQVLRAMGHVAGWALHAGTVRLTGMTSNDQPFAANPQRIWYVTDSHAVVNGHDLGPIGPLAEQARLGDFYLPQRGIFALGRVYVDTSRAAAWAGR